MRPLIAGLAVAALSLCAAASFAQEQRRYEVDSENKVGRRRQTDAGR